MSEHAVFTDNNDVDYEGFGRVLNSLLIAGIFQTGDWLVTQRGAGANMSVDIAAGAGVLSDALGFLGYAYSTSTYNLGIDASDPTNPRKSIIVAYIDKSVTGTTNGLGQLKFKEVKGTAAGSPSDPSDGTIQSSVGSGNPFIKLARVTVDANETQIQTSPDITTLATRTSLNPPAGSIGSGATLDSGIIISPTVKGAWDAWIATNETIAYASATTFTCSAALAAALDKGTKIKLTQNSLNKFFYVVSKSGTTITVSPGVQDNFTTATTLTNHTITNAAYSNGSSPAGFPGWIPYTPEWKGSSSDPVLNNGTLTGWFKMDGSEVHVQIFASMGSTTTYGTGDYLFGLPILPKTGSGFGITPAGGAFFIDSSASASYVGLPYIQDSTASSPYSSRMTVLFSSATTTGKMDAGLAATVPFTFAQSDQIRISAVYRAN